ncbi:MAG TPA: ZIP family metal transporter [Solirubrobacteraceae bacterium]|jgi:ZIP family zinc transporter|nr:ZIP family metal transporter [Solirubrobacteraceae bacterium]
MSFAETAVLGAIAGFTIYIGLPLGRMERVDDRMRVCLAMFSVGILTFIFMDVTTNAEAIVASALHSFKEHTGSFGEALGLFAILAVGFTVGVAGISAFERRLRARAVPPPIAGGAPQGGAVAGEVAVVPVGTPAPAVPSEVEQVAAQARARALHTGMVIATAIGLHNFAEGLAIGVSAKTGAIGLATVLIIGFGLHNATEGFGIVGPLGDVRPSWKWLGLAGLIGGGPTFLGTLVGYQVDSSALELLFYALAGGAVLYVVGEIWNGMRRYGYRTLGLWMLAAGFLLGVATDLVVTYGGA